MKRDKISIIIPCYNEEECIEKIYNEIDKVSKKMKDQDFEIVYVNDGSKDNSLEEMKKLHKKDDRVRFVSFSKNFGKEAGLRAGLEYCTGDYATYMDVDLQDPPELLIEMYKGIKEEGYDCVAACSDVHKDYSLIRRGLTKVWYKLIGKISGSQQVPGARDYRLMTRRMVDALLEITEYNRYIKGFFSYVGFNVKWIEYEIPERDAGTSKFTLSKLIKYAAEGIVSFSTKPLVIAAYLGVFFCIVSIVYMLFILIRTLIVGNGVSGWPSLVCLITFIGGLQLFFLGVIGLYLSKIYLEVKGRPIYIVKETEKDM
ncbi:MAG: glycosyltransferase [Bacilli bacterium]|nr:glycosyltransferase [Bacilli bacterium]